MIGYNSMRFAFKTIVFLFFSFTAIGQSRDADTTSRSVDSIEYRYPYFGHHIPPYFGVIGGYEGFKSSYWEAGLIFNIAPVWISSKTGGIVGGTISYKRNFQNNIQAFESEIGFYSPVSLGLNFNYTFTENHNTFGCKPFIGISVYHLQFLWGYNFFSAKKNEIQDLRHSTFKIRYSLPLLRMDKKRRN